MMIRDISELTKSLLDPLLAENRIFSITWQDNENQTILHASNIALEILGFSEDEIVGGSLKKLINTSLKDNLHVLCKKADGKKIWLQHSTLLFNEKSRYNFTIFRDVTSQITDLETLKNLNKQLKNYKKAIKDSEVVIKTNSDGIILSANEIYCTLCGYKKSEVKGKALQTAPQELNAQELNNAMRKGLSQNNIWRGVIKDFRKDGSEYWISLTTTLIKTSKNGKKTFLSIGHDISLIMQKRDLMLRHAYKNALTNLPNRQQLFKDFSESQIYGVAIFDIANFSQFNDLYGYKIGNQIITQIANKLRTLTLGKYKLYHICRLRG